MRNNNNPELSPELVVGLIGAIGTNMEAVITSLTQAFMTVGYEVQNIRLSDYLSTLKPAGRKTPIREKGEKEQTDKYYKNRMDAGNAFRAQADRADAFAFLAASAIRDKRIDFTGDHKKPRASVAYVLRSLKRKEEITKLRQIYGRNFVALAAYSDRRIRIKRLSSMLAAEYAEKNSSFFQRKAEDLVDRDRDELSKEFGQNIQAAFPLSDFFVDSDRDDLDNQIKRIVELLFGHPFHSPSREEFGMFHAYATALSSASLARQVGASICTQEGELMATGCNEVPKAGGGNYWGGDKPDARDHQREEKVDSNDQEKKNILSDLLARLRDTGFLRGTLKKASRDQLLDKALQPERGAGNSDLMNITEYGRMVHAEMAALMQASRLGVAVKHSVMYCTTFPCHNCAKHIVAAGVRRLIYIEPYPKSHAFALHEDAISDGEGHSDGQKVVFRPFVGVSPEQYFRLFALGELKRKRQGTSVDWHPAAALLRFPESPMVYILRESAAIVEYTPRPAKMRRRRSKSNL